MEHKGKRKGRTLGEGVGNILDSDTSGVRRSAKEPCKSARAASTCRGKEREGRGEGRRRRLRPFGKWAKRDFFLEGFHNETHRGKQIAHGRRKRRYRKRVSDVIDDIISSRNNGVRGPWHATTRHAQRGMCKTNVEHGPWKRGRRGRRRMDGRERARSKADGHRG